jgi:large subunit ribosomal protein L20
MPRAKGGFKTRRRRKRILQMTKGYYGSKSRLYRIATEAVDKALTYAYKDRRLKKRDFRSLWIIRINAALRVLGLTYSQFMNKLKVSNITLNRKALADMAYNDPPGFSNLVKRSRKGMFNDRFHKSLAGEEIKRRTGLRRFRQIKYLGKRNHHRQDEISAVPGKTALNTAGFSMM